MQTCYSNLELNEYLSQPLVVLFYTEAVLSYNVA
jgi:hypothetical protein